MNATELQQQLFQVIKSKVPAEMPVVDEISRLLGISSDSAYRRMRGEKTISIDELYQLAVHYHISLDQIMDISKEGMLFQGNFIDRTNFRFEDYVNGIIKDLSEMNRFKEKEFYYVCKDLPIFHHYHVKEIAAFKWFFWLKTYFQFPEFEKKKFSFSGYPEALYELEQKTVRLYYQLPSTELWNLETMNILFRQIEFYRDAEVFESDHDALILYESIEKLWNYLEEQATLGFRFYYNDPEKKPLVRFRMYFNEVYIGDNSFLAILDGVKLSLMAHTTINYIKTTDVAFTQNAYNHIQNLMKRSTLISEVSEKERSRFFRIIREKIQKRKEALDV